MDIKDMYYGIHSEQQKKYEEEVIERYGDKARVLYEEMRKRTVDWTQADLDLSRKQNELIMAQLALAMQQELAPASKEVQALAKAQLDWLSTYYTVSKQLFIELGEVYVSDDRFRAFYDQFRPGLAAFLRDAMRIYAEKNL